MAELAVAAEESRSSCLLLLHRNRTMSLLALEGREAEHLAETPGAAEQHLSVIRFASPPAVKEVSVTVMAGAVQAVAAAVPPLAISAETEEHTAAAVADTTVGTEVHTAAAVDLRALTPRVSVEPMAETVAQTEVPAKMVLLSALVSPIYFRLSSPLNLFRLLAAWAPAVVAAVVAAVDTAAMADGVPTAVAAAADTEAMAETRMGMRAEVAADTEAMAVAAHRGLAEVAADFSQMAETEAIQRGPTVNRRAAVAAAVALMTQVVRVETAHVSSSTRK